MRRPNINSGDFDEKREGLGAGAGQHRLADLGDRARAFLIDRVPAIGCFTMTTGSAIALRTVPNGASDR